MSPFHENGMQGSPTGSGIEQPDSLQLGLELNSGEDQDATEPHRRASGITAPRAYHTGSALNKKRVGSTLPLSQPVVERPKAFRRPLC